MKKLHLLLVSIGFYFASYSQTPNWGWAKGSNGGNYEYGQGVIMDTSNLDVFVGFRASGSCTIGGKTVNSTGADNPVIGKFDSAGNAIWLSINNYSGGYDYIWSLCRDNSNNVYATGTVNSGSGTYVEKYNNSGVLQWGPETASPGATGLTVDNQGNVYVFGGFQEGGSTYTTVHFGIGSTGTLTNPAGGGFGMYIVKLNKNGYYVWGKTISTNTASNAADIITDNLGNLYITGSYNGTDVFGTITSPASSGISNAFIAKYDTAGNAIWLNTATNAGIQTPFGVTRAIEVDPCGNTYITGIIQNTAQFGSLSVTSNGGQDMYVAKCHNDGKWEWVNSAGGTGNDAGYAISLDKNYDVYVAGNYGSTSTGINFGSGISYTGAGTFVVKYSNSAGQPIWAQVGGGTTGIGIGGMDVDKWGYVYITGSYSGTVAFGSSHLTASASGNVYIAKLDTVANRLITPTLNSHYCASAAATIPYTIAGSFNSGNQFIAQLSDATGNFVSATNIGSVTSTTGGTINITIPVGASGSNYLIRVVSTNPATSSYANGCGANTYPNNFPVTISSGLTVNVTPSSPTVCKGSSVTLKASGGTTYQWSATNTADTIIASPLADTTYSVTATSGLCTGSTTVAVTVTPTPIVSITGTTTVCAGISSTLTGSAGTGATYVWDDGSTNSTFLATPPVNGTKYYVTGTASGCSASDTVTMTVNPLPVLSILPANPAICAGSSVTLTASGGANYIWPVGNTSNSITVSPAQDTTLKVIGSTLLGCVDSTTVTLTVNANPTVTVTPSLTVCGGNIVPLTATGGGNYLWNDGETSNTISVTATNTALYTVTVTTPVGSCTAKDSTTIMVNPAPANTVSGATTLTIGEQAPLSTSNTAAGNTYSWAPATGLSCTTCPNPIATPSSTTTYTLTITDNSGCDKQDSALITVKELCGSVYMANAFSPNGDGSNDVLKVQGNCIKGLDLIIFDRWGNKVYETTNPNDQWDGTSKGRALNTGTYVYTLVVTDQDNNTINKKGNITLLR